MAIREYMDIRSYINILWLFELSPSAMLGQHGYPKLHKYFMAIRENMDIRSYINILWTIRSYINILWLSEVT